MAAQVPNYLSSNYVYAGGLAVTLVAGLLFTGHRLSSMTGLDGISLPTAKSELNAGRQDGPQEHHRRLSHPHGRPLGLLDFPGPKREFFLGNARSIPRSGWSDAFDSWRRQFGTSPPSFFIDILFPSLFPCRDPRSLQMKCQQPKHAS
jgi:hypothetical protein